MTKATEEKLNWVVVDMDAIAVEAPALGKEGKTILTELSKLSKALKNWQERYSESVQDQIPAGLEMRFSNKYDYSFAFANKTVKKNKGGTLLPTKTK